MNISTSSRRSAGWILPLLGIVSAASLLGLLLAAYAVTGYVRLSRDAGALRDSLMQSTSAAWTKQIEINVGSFTVGLVRWGLSCVDLDPEVRLALAAFRGAEVGVYHLREGQASPVYAPILASADQAMTIRGWERVVGVRSARELVALYVPRNLNSASDVRVCLLVLNGPDLVVVSARSNLEPLLQLAMDHVSRDRQFETLAHVEH